MAEPVVGVVMGSDSDWETMQHAARRLEELGVPFECRVVSAHRTPACDNRVGGKIVVDVAVDPVGKSAQFRERQLFDALAEGNS